MKRKVNRDRRAVLLVDDDSGMRLAVERVLSESFAVTSAGSFVAANELINSGHHFDALVTDFDLKSGADDGLAVAQSLLARAPGTPVVVATGTIQTHERLQALLALPRVRLVEKPFQASELLAALDDLLSKAT